MDTVEEFLVTFDNDCFRKWNVTTSELVFSFHFDADIWGINVCLCGQFIIATDSEGDEGKICVWSSETGNANNEIENLVQAALDDAHLDISVVQGCSGNDSLLSMTSNDRTAVVLKLSPDNKVSLSTWETPDANIFCVLNGDGSKLFCLDLSQTMSVLNTQSGLTLISQFHIEFELRDIMISFAGDQICYICTPSDDVPSDSRDFDEHPKQFYNCQVIDVETHAVVHSLSNLKCGAYSCAGQVILM